MSNESAKQKIKELLKDRENQIADINQRISDKTKEKEILENEYKQAEVQGFENAKDLFNRKNELANEIEYLKSRLEVLKESISTTNPDINDLAIKCLEETKAEMKAKELKNIEQRERIEQAKKKYNDEMAIIQKERIENESELNSLASKLIDILDYLPIPEGKKKLIKTYGAEKVLSYFGIYLTTVNTAPLR